MVVEILTFRVRHDGPLARFSRERPHLALTAWCNWDFDVFELTGGARADAEALAHDLGHGAEIHEAGTGQLVVMPCSEVEHNVVARLVERARCLHVPPARHHDGWESATTVAFGHERSRELFHRLREDGHEVELLAKREAAHHPLLQAGGPGVGTLLASLTDRQAESVLLAHRHGYYASPRRTTAAAIADSLGLSRSTFEEHLRKAELQLVNSLIPYLELELRTRKLKRAPTPTPPA